MIDRSRANPRDIGYDLEAFGNVFTCTAVHIQTGWRWIFEISDRFNHSKQLYEFVRRVESHKMRGVGYNNEFFDYPLLHEFMKLYSAQQGIVYAHQLKVKSNAIIASGNNDATKFVHSVWPRDRYFEQVDLMKIHHFDNPNKRTSLKMRL